MNKRPQIDNLTQNSGKNNVIKNLTSGILLSRFSINIARVWNATLSRLRFRESRLALCRCVTRSRARALGRINFMKSPLYSHRKHHTSVAASNVSGYVLSVQAHRGCIQKRHVRIHRAGAASFVLVSQCAFQCILHDDERSAGRLPLCRNFVHDTAPSPQTYVANITRPPIVKRATYIF